MRDIRTADRARAAGRGTVAFAAGTAARLVVAVAIAHVVIVSITHFASFAKILRASDALAELGGRIHVAAASESLRRFAVQLPRFGRLGPLTHTIPFAIFHRVSFRHTLMESATKVPKS